MHRAQTCVAGEGPASCCIDVSTVTGEVAWWLDVPLLLGCSLCCFLVLTGSFSSSDPDAECSSSLRKW